MKNRKFIRLTESDLHGIIKESVKTTLNERFGEEWNYGNDDEWDDDKNNSMNFDDVYQSIIDCNDTIRNFFINTYSFVNSDDARSCKRILSIADSLKEAAHEFQEHLAWD